MSVTDELLANAARYAAACMDARLNPYGCSDHTQSIT